MIDAEHVRFAYHGAGEVLKDLSVKENTGHCLALLGNNGAGKSTFLKCVNRILSHQGGVITVDARDVKRLSRGEIARTMAYVEQHTATPTSANAAGKPQARIGSAYRTGKNSASIAAGRTTASGSDPAGSADL